MRQCAAVNDSRNEQGQRTLYCEKIGSDECPYTASSVCVLECQHFIYERKCVESCPDTFSVDSGSGEKRCG